MRQQAHFALIDGAVVGRDRGRGRAMEVGEQVDGAGVDGQLLARRIVHMFLDSQVAEILDQDQPLLQVAGQYAGGGKALIQQMFGNGDEGARVFVRGWRVHQHGTARAVDDAEIAAEGGVACQRHDGGIAPPRLTKEIGRGGGGDHICDHRSVQASGTSAVKSLASSPSTDLAKAMVKRSAWDHSRAPSRSGHSMINMLSIR